MGAVQKFTEDHPFLTFLIAIAAIDGVVCVVRNVRGKDRCEPATPLAPGDTRVTFKPHLPFLNIERATRSAPAVPYAYTAYTDIAALDRQLRERGARMAAEFTARCRQIGRPLHQTEFGNVEWTTGPGHGFLSNPQVMPDGTVINGGCPNMGGEYSDFYVVGYLRSPS